MVDAKVQQHRSSPSGPIGDRKAHGTVGGKGTTLSKNASHTFTVSTVTIPALAGLKITDMVVVQPDSAFGDGNNAMGGATVTNPGEVTFRVVNPTGVDITDFTMDIDILIFPFNI